LLWRGDLPAEIVGELDGRYTVGAGFWMKPFVGVVEIACGILLLVAYIGSKFVLEAILHR